MHRLVNILVFILGFAFSLLAQTKLTVSKGNATLLDSPSGIDNVFIFENLKETELQTTDANPVWWRMQGTDSAQVAVGTDYFYPEHNTGYILHTDAGRTSFWVIDYDSCKIAIDNLLPDLQFDNRCEQTKLDVSGVVPEMYYLNQYGSKKVINRTAQVVYTTLAWDGEQWADSICEEEVHLMPVTKDKPTYLTVGAPLRDTQFSLIGDQFSAKLDIEPDTVFSPIYEACAVASHPTTITTVRGTKEENQLSNEVERPTDETVLKGSAPLDILFRANGNIPVAKYYQWKILKGSDLIAQRTDEEHRYVFDDYGEYRVLLWVSGDKCQPTDSTEILISVSASQLLVPNVFTPNGDGKNDEFRMMYRSIIEFDCWVYNRWGKLVYHWNDPAKGWDGTINGRPAAEGAYYYVIRARGADAEAGSGYTSKSKYKKNAPIGIYQLSGDINLLRGN